jgi:hypothetical protein
VILLCGIPSERPLAMVAEELDALGAPYAWFNQRRFAEAAIDFEVSGGEVGGALRLGGRVERLEAIAAVYTRLMDDRLLPELRDEPEPSPLRDRCRAVHEALGRWLEVAPARVVNRARPMGSNFSKPYQAQLIQAQGFQVPETLITNVPERVVEFLERHGRVVYKSISGVRSIVRTLAPEDLERLDRIRWCPTQFQRFVPGLDVRVHTVGGQTFATAAHSDSTDYRYAGDGEASRLEAIELDDELAGRCLRLAAALGLAFAGIDLKVAPGGEVYCFEVNPSPAFSYYELNTGQPIARAVAAHLAGRDGAAPSGG